MNTKRLIASSAAIAILAMGSAITGCSNTAATGTPPQPPTTAKLTETQLQAIRDNPNIPPDVKANMLKSEQGPVTAGAPATPPPGFGPPKPPK